MITFDLKNKNTWLLIGGTLFLLVILFIIFSKFFKKKNLVNKKNVLRSKDVNDFYPLKMSNETDINDENEGKNPENIREIRETTGEENEIEENEMEEEEKVANVDSLPQLLNDFPNPQAKAGILQLILQNYSKLIQEFANIKSELPDFGGTNVKIPENLQEKINEYNERAKITYDKLSDGLDKFTKMLIDELQQYVNLFKNKTTEGGVPFSKELSQNELSTNLNLYINTMKLSIEILQSFLNSNVLSKNLKGNIIKLIDEKELSSFFSDFYSFSTNYSQGSLLKGAKFNKDLQGNINEVVNSFRKLINFIPLPSPPSTSLEIIPTPEVSSKKIFEEKTNEIAIPPQQPPDLNRNSFPSQIRRNIPMSDLSSIVENGKI